MCAPIVLVMAVLSGYPLVKGVLISLTNMNESNVGTNIGMNHIPATYHGVGLHNYLNILSGDEGQFYGSFWWTLEWTAACVSVTVALGLGLAVLINRRVRGRGLYRVALIIPWAVPGFVSAFAWRLILDTGDGILNKALTAVGLPAIDWLGGETSAKLSVIGVNIWMGVPFMMVAFLGGLQSIPDELHEAAEVDGASPPQRFWNVTLPGLRPVALTVSLLSIIWTFNQFAVIYLITGGGPGGSTNILVTQAYNLAFAGIFDYANASTYGVIILSVIFVFAFFYRRVLRRAEEVVV